MAVLTYKVDRLKGPMEGPDRTLSFLVRPERVRRRWKFFRPHEVPPVEGDAAWFDIDRKSGGWILVRQAPEPKEPESARSQSTSAAGGSDWRASGRSPSSCP